MDKIFKINILKLLSIIIPTFNSSSTLLRLLNSIPINKNLIEVLVIDGLSTDSTCKIASLHPVVDFVLSELDSGQSSAINKGFRLSTGYFVTFIGADDYYNKPTFSIFIEYLSLNLDIVKNYGLVACSFSINDNLKNTLTSLKSFGPVGYADLSIGIPYRIHQVSCFFNRNKLDNSLLIVNENLKFTMDRELLYRVIAKNKAIYLDYNISTFVVSSNCKSGSSFILFYLEFAKINLFVGCKLFGIKDIIFRINYSLKLINSGILKLIKYRVSMAIYLKVLLLFLSIILQPLQIFSFSFYFKCKNLLKKT